VFYLVVTVQTAINAGITIGSILIAGDCLQVHTCIVLKLEHMVRNSYVQGRDKSCQ
jgi:hypothetical protein